LISSALQGVAPAGERWYGRLAIQNISAIDATGLFPICPTDEETKDAQNRLGGTDFFPFVVYASDACSTFTGVKRENAKVKLDVIESWWLEREFWEGSLALGNPSLVGADSDVLGTSEDVKTGFGLIDAAIATSGHDGRGMIHLDPATFDALQGYELFRREGNVWLSPLDNYVVPGHGYTGNGPNPGGGANENAATDTVRWIYGHPGMVVVYRGPVIFTPPETDGPDKEAIDRQTNDIVVYAERAIGFVLSNPLDDGEVGFYAVSVDLTTGAACCAGEGGGGGGLTNAELRATPVPVSGTVTTGGLTDTQLRATAVPVSGPLTDTQLRATAVPISQATATVTRTRANADSGGGGLAHGTLYGWFIEETAAVAAIVRIRFGDDNADTPFIPIHLAAGESVSFWSERGIPTGGNIFYDVVSGTVDGVLFSN
jgi:hypothetical protein